MKDSWRPLSDVKPTLVLWVRVPVFRVVERLAQGWSGADTRSHISLLVQFFSLHHNTVLYMFSLFFLNYGKLQIYFVSERFMAVNSTLSHMSSGC